MPERLLLGAALLLAYLLAGVAVVSRWRRGTIAGLVLAAGGFLAAVGVA